MKKRPPLLQDMAAATLQVPLIDVLPVTMSSCFLVHGGEPQDTNVLGKILAGGFSWELKGGLLTI